MRNKVLRAVIMNSLIIVLEIIGLIMSSIEHGFGMFQFYTQDSNYLLLISCVIYVIYGIIHLKKGKEIPNFVKYLKYTATVCVTLTFVVVVVVLVPMSGFSYFIPMLFYGTMLYHHFLCPVLAIITFLLFEVANRYRFKDLFLVMIPTFIYEVIIIILNICKVIKGPYPFLYVYEQPFYMSIIWVIVIPGIAFLFAYIYMIINNKIVNKQIQ